jgi:hypothetical protein
LGYTALALALSLFLSTCCGLVKRILKSIEWFQNSWNDCNFEKRNWPLSGIYFGLGWSFGGSLKHLLPFHSGLLFEPERDSDLVSDQGDRIGRLFAFWATFRLLGDFSPFGRLFAFWATFRLLGDFSPIGRRLLWPVFLNDRNISNFCATFFPQHRIAKH